MNHDALLWSQIVFESGLATSGVLDLGAQAESVELQKFEHLICASASTLTTIALDDKETRLEPMAQQKSHSAESRRFHSLTL